MVTWYMTALTPPKGAEGDLDKFRLTLSETRGWVSPLPSAVPLHLFSLPFPRDRVDSSVLGEMPPLSLTGPVEKGDCTILELENESPFYDSKLYLRPIHGKPAPSPEKSSFIDWKGLLLTPVHSSICKKNSIDNFGTIRFHYKTWQLCLYKIRVDKDRLWWEDFSWTKLWNVRKPSS